MALLGSCLVALGIAEKTAGALDATAGAVFGERASDMLRDMQQRMQAFTGRIPRNHDLERAMRACELGATWMILRQWQADWVEDGIGAGDVRIASPPPFLAAAENWVLTQLGLCPSLRLEMDEALVTRMEEALDGFLATGQPDTAAAQAVAETEQAVLAALVEGAKAGPAPEVFRDRFLHGSADRGGLPPWRLCFLGLMREVLKNNPKARDAFLVSRTARLVADSTALKPVVASLLGDVEAIRALLASIAASHSRMEAKIQALPDAVAEKISHLDPSNYTTIIVPFRVRVDMTASAAAEIDSLRRRLEQR